MALEEVCQRFKVWFDNIVLLFFFVCFRKCELLAHIDQFLLFLLLHFLEGKFVEWSVKQHDFLPLLEQFCDNWIVFHCCFIISAYVLNICLSRLESLGLLFEWNEFVSFCGLEAEKFYQFGTLSRVVDHSLLDIVPEVLVKVQLDVAHIVKCFFLCLVFFILFVLSLFVVQSLFLFLFVCKLSQTVNHLPGCLFANDLHGFVLIDGFSTHVQREIIRVDNSSRKIIHPKWQEFIKFVSN